MASTSSSWQYNQGTGLSGHDAWSRVFTLDGDRLGVWNENPTAALDITGRTKINGDLIIKNSNGLPGSLTTSGLITSSNNIRALGDVRAGVGTLGPTMLMHWGHQDVMPPQGGTSNLEWVTFPSSNIGVIGNETALVWQYISSAQYRGYWVRNGDGRPMGTADVWYQLNPATPSDSLFDAQAAVENKEDVYLGSYSSVFNYGSKQSDNLGASTFDVDTVVFQQFFNNSNLTTRVTPVYGWVPSTASNQQWVAVPPSDPRFTNDSMFVLGGKEPGNLGVYNGSSFHGGFLTGDYSGDGAQWNKARLIIRACTTTTIASEAPAVARVETYNYASGWTNTGQNFNMPHLGYGRGYGTTVSPWFTLHTLDVPSVGIRILSTAIDPATGFGVAHRIGPVHMQFGA